MTTALFFIGITCLLYICAFIKGPIWALLAYVNVYFNTPDPNINWWASYLPFTNWSVVSTVVLLASMVIHRDQLSARSFKSVNFVFLFVLLTYLISFTTAEFSEDAYRYANVLLSFALASFFIVKVVRTEWQFRTLWLTLICLVGYLSLNAYLYGERIHGRLENIGPSDSHASNEFSLLLAGIMPFIIPFILKGKRLEKVLCFLCLPFVLNAFVLCNSRGAVVALVVAFIIATLVVVDNEIRIRMIIVGVLLLAVVSYLADQEMVDRVSSLLRASAAMSDDEQANTLSSGRMEIWRYGFQMVKDYPSGAGPNAFKHLARFYMPKEILTYHPGAAYGVRSAHNSYLQVLVEQGYFGFFIWLVICGYSVILIYSAFLKLKSLPTVDPFWRYAVFASAVSFLSILLGSLFNSRIYYEFFWWQVAMSVVLASLVGSLEIDENKLVN